jgi:hypothetical protein
MPAAQRVILQAALQPLGPAKHQQHMAKVRELQRARGRALPTLRGAHFQIVAPCTADKMRAHLHSRAKQQAPARLRKSTPSRLTLCIPQTEQMLARGYGMEKKGASCMIWQAPNPPAGTGT